jgi:2-haloacid dehalogenase
MAPVSRSQAIQVAAGNLDEIQTLVFDVLGTVVDEGGSILAEISSVLSSSGRDPAEAPAIAAEWARRLELLTAEVVGGHAEWRSNDTLRRAALHETLAVCDVSELPDTIIEHLALVGHRLAPWPDSPRALHQLSRSFGVVALSNADLAQLLDMFAAGGLCWHGVLSAEFVQAYKPDPTVYRMALDGFGLDPHRTLMVAAHPWDLRAARARGLRTAYVTRPGEGAASADDGFDLYAEDLAHLARMLTT